jgi:hypothetical protein
MITWRNFKMAIEDQLPLRRFLYGLFISGNARGLFHINSHRRQDNGQPKIPYSTKENAVKAAQRMHLKTGAFYSPYKCLFCDGYHIGKSLYKEQVDVL